jgi:tellurite resistance protein TehA-like permease
VILWWLITWLMSIPLRSGAVVMATGIVAIGLSRIGITALSDPLLAAAAAIWLLLVVAAGLRLRVDSAALRSELSSPAALSLVAATGVLGAAAVGLGWKVPAAGLLALSALLLVVLTVPVLRSWQTPTQGVSFLLAVAVASVSVAASELSRAAGVGWLVIPAGICWALALLAYLFVFSRFELRELLSGRGDHWVAGGALTIAALAGGELCLSLRANGHPFSSAVEVVVTLLWAAASAWMVALLLSELARPRWGYHHLRWATVFPLGMYGVGSSVLGTILSAAPLQSLAVVFVWIGFGAWLLVAAGLLSRGPAPIAKPPLQETGAG